MKKVSKITIEEVEMLHGQTKLLIIKTTLEHKIFKLKRYEIFSWLEKYYEDILEEMYQDEEQVNIIDTFSRLSESEDIEIYKI